MSKSHKSVSKYHVGFKIIIAVIILMGSITVIVSFIAANRYWNRSHLQNAVLDLSEYDRYAAQNDSDLDETKAIVHKCNEEAAPIRDELSPFFDNCNGMIIDYFWDIYGVDITEKLDALHVMESVYPEEVSQMVGGSHSVSFPDKLFLNKAVIDSYISDMENGETSEAASTEFSAKMLRTVYIHETMHYLGFDSDSGFDHFTEAIAEYLNREVMLHSGIKYESITGYASIQKFAAQIAECDTELIRDVLIMDNINIADSFNSKLGNRFDVNYAAYYDKLIGLIQSDNSKDIDRIVYYTQYLTYEYCKSVNNNAREISKTDNTVNFFEIKWLFNVY